MEHIGYILGAGIITSIASLSGLLVIKSNKKVSSFIERQLEPLSAFSGGIFLFTSFAMGRHAIHSLEIYKAITSYLIGFILFIFFHKMLTGHRHDGDSKEHIHEHSKKSALKMIIGDTIHNIADGLMLVASYGLSPVIGLSTAISTFLHEVPQEISEFIVLIKSGYSVKEASIKNFMSALSIFIGIGIGLFFMNTQTLQGFLVGISSVFFLGIIFTDLFPLRKLNKIKEKKMQKNIILFILGTCTMALIMHFLGH